MISQFLASHHLVLKSDPEKHRVIKASKRIPKGTTILSSNSLSSIPTREVQATICNQCFQPSEKLLVCSVCKKKAYCSQACQKEAWVQHKNLCKAFYEHKTNATNLTRDKELTLDLEMLVHVVLTLNKIKNSDKKISDSLNVEAFDSLLSHIDKHNPDDINYYKTIANRVRDFLTSKSINVPDTKTLIEYLGKFRCNNFVIHDSQLFSIGEGTFPIGSLFNHSCFPNCIPMYEGGSKQRLISIRDIEQGEEICYSYVDGITDRSERKKILFEKYFFDCRCERCGVSDSDNSPLSSLDRLLSRIPSDRELSEIDGSLSKSPLASFVAASMDRFSPILRVSTSKEFLSCFDHLIVSYLRSSTTAIQFSRETFKRISPRLYKYIDRGDWFQAVDAAKYVLVIYMWVYVERYHPLIGLQWFLLGKCLWNVGGMIGIENKRIHFTKEAKLCLEMAKECLVVTHGWEGEGGMVNEVEALIKVCNTELGV